jgi:hypothetical protein
MKARVVGVSLGLIVFLVMAGLVIQRLSAEAMAVFVGVVAGVAASVPTSLIVMWFALRLANARNESPGRVVNDSHPVEPRIVVVSPSAVPTPLTYGPATPMALPAYAQPAPRRFTVIGGGEGSLGETPEDREVVWRP